MANSKTDMLIGNVTKEKCPKCKPGKLFRNKAGSEWCSQLECEYHMVRKSPRSKVLIPAHERLALKTAGRKGK